MTLQCDRSLTTSQHAVSSSTWTPEEHECQEYDSSHVHTDHRAMGQNLLDISQKAFFKVRLEVRHIDTMVPPIGNCCLTVNKRGRKVNSTFDDCMIRYEFTDVNMYTNIVITGGKNEVKDMTVQVSGIVNLLCEIT